MIAFFLVRNITLPACVVFRKEAFDAHFFQKADVDAIIRLSLSELREAIVSSRLKPIEVLRAYQTKVRVSQSLGDVHHW